MRRRVRVLMGLVTMSRLERLSRLTALICCTATAIALGGTIAAGFRPVVAAKLGWAAPDGAAYASGQRIDLPASAYAMSDRTLVVFGSGTCGASRRSTPAVNGLVAAAREAGAGIRIVTPATMKPDQAAWLAGLDVTPEERLTADVTTMRVAALPTFVVVDRHGTVLAAREGLLDEAGRLAVVQAIRTGHG